MKRSTKALLLSALVCPGSGHIYLRKYIPGLALISITLACLYYLIARATEQALQVVAEIQSGNVPLDPIAINELITRQQAAGDNLWQNIATALLAVCWVIGMIDSYRLGARQDKEKQT